MRFSQTHNYHFRDIEEQSKIQNFKQTHIKKKTTKTKQKQNKNKTKTTKTTKKQQKNNNKSDSVHLRTVSLFHKQKEFLHISSTSTI